jgi:hypothetical protein
MNRLPAVCPVCAGTLVVQQAHCRQCDTTLSGTFEPTPGSEFADDKLPVLRRFALLSGEQLTFLEAFVRSEGKLNRMQEEVGMSYPTLRLRLDEMLKTLGFTPRDEEKARDQERRQILDELQAGRISPADAMEMLRKGKN